MGAIQYCCITCSKLAFSVSPLCEFLTSPAYVHMRALKRVLIYLQGTSTHGLHMLKFASLDLLGFLEIGQLAQLTEEV